MILSKGGDGLLGGGAAAPVGGLLLGGMSALGGAYSRGGSAPGGVPLMILVV